MYTYNELLEILNKKIETLTDDQYPLELYTPIKYFLSIGGKRLRPVILLMANNIFKDDINQSVMPAIGIELFHNFTLIHDDIMDNSSVRRNRPTVHTKWDKNIAILSGDTISIMANNFISNCGSLHIKDVLAVFNQAAIKVCEGQQYDMNFEKQHEISIDEYLNMIKLKTAALISASTKIGGILGDAKDKDIENLYNFGLYIGLAFQIQDDLLDIYGDTKSFGKKIGSDILNNKKTYPILKALEISDDDIKNKLTKYLESIASAQDDISNKVYSVIDIFNNLNIKKITRKKIHEYYTKAQSHLGNIHVPHKRKNNLQDFIATLIDREI